MSTISSSTTSTTAYKVTADTTGTLVIQTGATPTTAVTVDASQNVGIGTSSPDYKLTIQNGDAAITLKDAGGTTRAYIGVAGVIGTAPTGALRLRSDQGGFVYGYQGTEQMRIDSSGNVLIGTTTGTTWKQRIIGAVRTLQLGNGETNNSDKYSLISSVHYTNSTYTDGTALIGSQSITGQNNVMIGGYFSEAIAATSIQFYTAANSTTIGGTERMRIDSSGNLLFNSGYGSVATAYGCRAWVNFNGTGAVAIRASANVTSITDNGVGDYTVNFTNAMPDGNYAYHIGSKQDQAGTGDAAFPTNGTPTGVTDGAAGMTTTRIRLRFVNLDGTASLRDQEVVCVSIFR